MSPVGPDLARFSDRSVGNSPRLRVLVVDDEALIRWSVGEALSRRGYAVVEAADAQGALAHFRPGADEIGAVVLDLRLPDSDGLDLLRTIKHAAPNCPVILITAYGWPGLRAEAVSAGAYCVLDKPFDVERLVDLVAEAVQLGD